MQARPPLSPPANHAACQWLIEMGADELPAARADALARLWRLTPEQRERFDVALDRWLKSAVRAELLAWPCVRAEVPFFSLGCEDEDIARYGAYAEGAIDALTTNPADSSRALVIDYKTGGTPDETPEQLQEKHALQARVYADVLHKAGFEAVTVMVQKEVAQRICARAGTADYSAFTVFCQYYAVPELLFDVPPSCFIPQPKVTSSVLKLTMRAAPPCEIPDEKLFFRVVKASFAQRRKTLLNALSSGLGELSKEALSELLTGCGLAPSVRGETLDIPAFARIANALSTRAEA